MSDAPTAVSSQKPARLPPEKQFWQRYSPHHEFPWSTIISVAIYVVIGLLAWALVKLAMDQSADNKSLPVLPIEIDSGGGGHHAGVEGSKNPGDTPITQNREAVADTNPTTTPPVPETVKNVPLKDILPDVSLFPDLATDSGRAVDDPAALEAMKKFEEVSENAKSSLARALGPPSKGKGGSGTGGGTGTGHGKGDGPGTGDGNIRRQRLARWTITALGNYRATVAAAGAILAIPTGKNPNPKLDEYLVIRDLDKIPPEGRREKFSQLEALQRLFVFDRDTHGEMARDLRLSFRPPYFIAFFPNEFENELATKEQQFAGRSEDQIERTFFNLQRMPNGKCEVTVTDQKAKPGRP